MDQCLCSPLSLIAEPTKRQTRSHHPAADLGAKAGGNEQGERKTASRGQNKREVIDVCHSRRMLGWLITDFCHRILVVQNAAVRASLYLLGQ
jgi:hypothetical protein